MHDDDEVRHHDFSRKFDQDADIEMAMQGAPPMMKMKAEPRRSRINRVAHPGQMAGVQDTEPGFAEYQSASASNQKTIGEELLAGKAAPKFDPLSVQPNKMMVRRGRLEIEAFRNRSMANLAGEVESVLTKLGGYVASRRASPSRHPGTKGATCGPMSDLSCDQLTMELRVPVTEFRQLASGLRGLVRSSEVRSWSESVDDVTAEFVDHAARAASMNATRAQLLLLMKKSDNVKDVLQVQRELRQVEQQLETEQARMQVLRKSATFSFLLFEAYPAPAPYVGPPPTPPRPGWSPTKTVGRALRWAGRVLAGAADAVIYTVVAAVPIGMLGGIVALVSQKYRWRDSMCSIGQYCFEHNRAEYEKESGRG